MKEFIWIEKEDCLGFHGALLARFGGLDGLRHSGLLKSRLARPLQLIACSDPDLFELAASYAHGIVKNHPFLDGNKQSCPTAAALFLELNGMVFQSPEEEAVLQTLALAAGEIDAGEYAGWLRKSCSPK